VLTHKQALVKTCACRFSLLDIKYVSIYHASSTHWTNNIYGHTDVIDTVSVGPGHDLNICWWSELVNRLRNTEKSCSDRPTCVHWYLELVKKQCSNWSQLVIHWQQNLFFFLTYVACWWLFWHSLFSFPWNISGGYAYCVLIYFVVLCQLQEVSICTSTCIWHQAVLHDWTRDWLSDINSTSSGYTAMTYECYLDCINVDEWF